MTKNCFDKCGKDKSIYSFNSTFVVSATAMPGFPFAVPTLTQAVNNLNLFPICQGKYAKAVCVNSSGVVSSCVFPNAVQIKKSALYGLKFKADVKVLNQLSISPLLIAAVLLVNGVAIQNSEYLNVLYNPGQSIQLFVELGQKFKRNDIVQISVAAFGATTATTIQVLNSKFIIQNIQDCYCHYAQFITTLPLSFAAKTFVPFAKDISNSLVKISSDDNTILKFKEDGQYKFHFYWNGLSMLTGSFVPIIPFSILILLDSKVVKTFDSNLIVSNPIAQDTNFVFNTDNWFFELPVHKDSRFQIIFESPGNVLFGITNVNSLLEIMQIKNSIEEPTC